MPNRGRTTISAELGDIVRSVGSIQAALSRLIPLLETARQSAVAANGSAAAPPAPRRRLRLSPERKAALKLQGQYMGYLRGLKPRERSRVKALAAAKGIRSAVGLARQLANK